jgi:hypothetical protein
MAANTTIPTVASNTTTIDSSTLMMIQEVRQKTAFFSVDAKYGWFASQFGSSFKAFKS